MMALLRWCLLGCAVSLCLGQRASFKNYEFKCDDGYKVATIQRERANGRRVGDMTLECEQIGGELQGVDCQPTEGPFGCQGGLEGCNGNQYLGGLLGFELDKKTGAVLFQPVCCSASNFEVIRATCDGRRLNAIRGAFKQQIGNNKVYTGMRCWRQYDLKNIIHDFIWKPIICDYLIDGADPGAPKPAASASSGEAEAPLYGGEEPTAGEDPSLCEKCSCDCGPFQCPDDAGLLTLVHKRRKRATCECVCNCEFKCI